MNKLKPVSVYGLQIKRSSKMKREHFEILWNACTLGEVGYVASPSILRIPVETWQEWELYRIIDGTYQPKKFLQPSGGVIGQLKGEYIEETDEFRVTAESMAGELVDLYAINKNEDEVPQQDVELLQRLVDRISISDPTGILYPSNVCYVVHRKRLAFYIAQNWEFDYDYKETPPGGYQVGLYNHNIPFIILTEVGQYRTMQAIEVAENLGMTNLVILNTQDVSMTESETERINNKGIIFLNTKEFLTNDGQPRWDVINFEEMMLGSEEFKHSSDFRQIVWKGVSYSLTAMQSGIVELLFENYTNGTPEVGQTYLLEHAGSQSNRLEHLFGRSQLWGTLIVPGERQGTFQLKIS